MTWQILDKPRTEKMISAVRSAGLGNLFAPATTEARARTLPFFNKTSLYRLTNYATLPAFSLFYLGDEDNYTYLDGGVEGVHFYCVPDNLNLTTETILPYLDFYLIFVQLDVGEINIRGARDQYNILEEFPEETEVEYDDIGKIYTINIPLYFDGTNMMATIQITHDGEVSITDTTMTVQSIQEKIDYDSTTDY